MIQQRRVLGFSIRSFVSRPRAEFRAAVEEILGCCFDRAAHGGVPMWSARILGMRVIFAPGTLVDGKETVQLHGFVDDARYLEQASEDEIQIVEIDISQAILDLLEVHGGGEWWIPNPADIQAEIASAQEEARPDADDSDPDPTL